MIDKDTVREVFLQKTEDCLEYQRKIRFKDGLRCIFCKGEVGEKLKRSPKILLQSMQKVF